MHFLITLILGVHFLLCQKVSSSPQSFFQNQTLSVDNDDGIIGKFFIELGTSYLQENKPRQVMIIGASNEELHQTQSLIESYPYNICTMRDIREYPYDFIMGSFLIIFLRDLKEKLLETNLEVLARCNGKCQFLFVFKGVINNIDDISTFIKRLVQCGVEYATVAHAEENNIKLYLPFWSNCTLVAGLALAWPGTNLSKIPFSSSGGLVNLKGCPIPIGTIASVPEMVIEENPNGSKTIVGGREGNLVSLIAKSLNFTVVVKYPSVVPNRNQSRKEHMIDEVASQIVIFAIARIRPIYNRQRKIEFSYSYGDECVTWGVPRRMSSTINLVSTEFPWKVWALIASVFGISCIITYIHSSKMDLSKNRNRKFMGFLSIVFDVLAINLGNPIVHIPASTGSKLALVLYLFYSLVITTSYKTSLESILTTMPSLKSISDGEGIIEANLKLGGSQYNLNILTDQDNSSEIVTKLIERYEVIHNNNKLINRLKFDHDFACLTRRSALIYEKYMAVQAQELITFDILGTCFLTYPTVIVLKEGSIFTSSVNTVLLKVIESGILKYWESTVTDVEEKVLEMKNADRISGDFTKQKFESVFIFYCSCLCVCLFVFFIELLVSKLKPKKIQRVPRPRRGL